MVHGFSQSRLRSVVPVCEPIPMKSYLHLLFGRHTGQLFMRRLEQVDGGKEGEAKYQTISDFVLT